jgi:hypothetical protein
MPRHLEGHDGSDDADHPDNANERPAAPPAASTPPAPSAPAVQRVQTGVRMEKRLVKVLKALAELYDSSLGDLLEGIVLHAFEGRSPFSAESLRRIAELQRIYGLDLEARAAHLSARTDRAPDLAASAPRGATSSRQVPYP